MTIKHEHTAVSNEIIESDFWNANHLIDNFTGNDIATFVGETAGAGSTSWDSVCIGYGSGENTVVGELTAVGVYAGWENTGTGVTLIGYSVGDSNTGDYVTALGWSACYGNTADNVVAIGYNAGKNNATANQFILKQANINATPLIQGDFSTGNVAIGKTSAGSKLGVAGLPIHANNAAAIIGGLAAGDFYRTNADPDPVCVVH